MCRRLSFCTVGVKGGGSVGSVRARLEREFLRNQSPAFLKADWRSCYQESRALLRASGGVLDE